MLTKFGWMMIYSQWTCAEGYQQHVRPHRLENGVVSILIGACSVV